MRRQSTLQVTERDRALAVAILTDAVCPCGATAVRIVVERPRAARKPRNRWDSRWEDSGAVVRSWCGRTEGHMGDDDESAYSNVDTNALALYEEDL